MTAVRGSEPDHDPLGFVSSFLEDRVHPIQIGPLPFDAIERVLRD
jgi:hypothetical protein